MSSTRVAQILWAVTQGATDAASLPHRLAIACAKSLPVTGVGMLLMTDTGPAGMLAATDGPAATMEELQFTLGEGPCIDSSRTGRPVLLPDLEVSGPPRWPVFSAGALEVGIRAIFAFPLRVGAIELGVLDLYRAEPGPLSAEQLAEALAFADAATSVLLHLQSDAGRKSPELWPIPVIENRAEVHQATGMIAFDAGVSLVQALMLLRARAYSSDRPILALARDVLTGDISFATDRDGTIRGS